MLTFTPRVSIGLPVYNGGKYLRRALDSLLDQEYENFELIVSDNASTDNTSTICEEYAKADTRVSFHRNVQNMGARCNFMRVLALAKGECFMWAAHDDFWKRQFLTVMLRELERHPEASVAMCSVERVRESGQAYDTVRYTGKADPSQMSSLKLAMALAAGRLYHLFIYGLYRTPFLKCAAFDFPAVVAGDRLFVCQLALAARFCYVDQVLHVRLISDQPIAEKYAHEELGRKWRDPFGRWKMTLSAGPYLLRSKVIPHRRKVWIPFIVARLAGWNLSVGIWRFLKAARPKWVKVKRFRASA